ncbi:MAG: hypothetical protein IT198_11605 [Acidimicrobiia bacterium]|nr:hypothetical protein [Acidimicrobiia bacterium]
MRPAVVVIVVTLIGLTFLWPFIVGLVRSLRHTPGISQAVGVPRVDLETAPCTARPGDVIVVRVRSPDADSCRLGWRDTHARDIPGAERDVALDGTVQWRLRVPPALTPGSRALVVTAQRGAVRRHIRIPVHVLSDAAAATHDTIPRLDLPERPIDPTEYSLATRTRRFGELTGFYRPGPSRPATQASVLATRMLDASVTPAPDAEPGLFGEKSAGAAGRAGGSRESAAS